MRIARAVIEDTHPVQSSIIVAAISIDIVGLYLINKYKKKESATTLQEKTAGDAQNDDSRWRVRRNAYWLLIAMSFIFSWSLDVYFAISPVLYPLKAYAMAFPVGLLDLYFSNTEGVPMKVILGAALWCSTVYFRFMFGNLYFQRGDEAASKYGLIAPDGKVISDFGFSILCTEALRYVIGLPFVGILSDLIFSPMHRLTHHPKLYSAHHKVHHEYTNKLTALVLYHGALLDDFLMPFCTCLGGTLYLILLSLIGLQEQAYSNVTGYLMIFNTLLSHAHDTRCARLLAPLPDDLNFVAYHYVHHLSPCNNYGLTKPSDAIWDKLLGVNTIRRLEDFEQNKRGEWKEKKAS